MIMITWQPVVSLTSQLAGQGAGPLRREGYCVGAAEEAAIYLIDDGSWKLGCMHEKINEGDEYLLWSKAPNIIERRIDK